MDATPLSPLPKSRHYQESPKSVYPGNYGYLSGGSVTGSDMDHSQSTDGGPKGLGNSNTLSRTGASGGLV